MEKKWSACASAPSCSPCPTWTPPLPSTATRSASRPPWWSELDTGGVPVALHPAPPGLRVALHLACPDLPAAVERLRACGVAVEGPRVEDGMDHWTATLVAPDGATIVLRQEP